jgi:methylenetetrahydrofolate--tRNA-(uracil-5-)-methyltransferase
MSKVHVVGSGLAGSEAAFFLAERGHEVMLHEMRPAQLTPAHKSGQAAELVCSNSLKSKAPESAPGMLKAEMTHVGSLILRSAAAAAVPGGEALAVDREVFSSSVTAALASHPRIQRIPGEILAPPEGEPCLLATGPLTSPALSRWLAKATGRDELYFYDAIAPIVDASTIDMSRAFLANRYDKGGEEAYLNCPMTQAEYEAFIDALIAAEKVPPKTFEIEPGVFRAEAEKFFQGCQPIEAIAAGGRDSLRYGPMKPVGLIDPATGKRSHAVLQLRPENLSRTAYNLVGFQTKLKYGEQSRVFRLIPALRNVEFLRLGSIHRNTYVCGPRALAPDLSLRGRPLVYLAGQITGVEGYLESAACGMLAGIFLHQRLSGRPHEGPPADTALGALLKHVVGGDPSSYQPSNIHFGLFEPSLFDGIQGLGRDPARKKMAEQAYASFARWWKRAGLRLEAA